jgi:hypothetical protein
VGSPCKCTGRDGTTKSRDVLLVVRLRLEGKEEEFEPAVFLLEPRHPRTCLVLSGTARPGIDLHDVLVGYTCPINSPNGIHVSFRGNILMASNIRKNRGRSGYLLTITECCGYSFRLFRTHSREVWPNPSVCYRPHLRLIQRLYLSW